MTADPFADTAPGRGTAASRGITAGFAAYALWGLFPLYFDALKPTGAWEILAHRIVWTLLLCAAILTVQRDWSWLLALRQQGRLVLRVAVAAVLIATNWVVYVSVVLSGHTSDAALGYFINPLITVALGVLVLRERLRPLQWAAVGIGLIACGYLTIAGGHFPISALVLACSFGTYGLVKKKVGDQLTALRGLTLETAILTPAAVALLAIIGATSGLEFGAHGSALTVMLALSGVATAVPLLLFAAAARRIPLVTVGLIQFVTPIMQLLCAVLLLGEQLPAERWIGFAIVWLALLLLSVDSLAAIRARRPAQPAR